MTITAEVVKAKENQGTTADATRTPIATKTQEAMEETPTGSAASQTTTGHLTMIASSRVHRKEALPDSRCTRQLNACLTNNPKS